LFAKRRRFLTTASVFHLGLTFLFVRKLGDVSSHSADSLASVLSESNFRTFAIANSRRSCPEVSSANFKEIVRYTYTQVFKFFVLILEIVWTLRLHQFLRLLHFNKTCYLKPKHDEVIGCAQDHKKGFDDKSKPTGRW